MFKLRLRGVKVHRAVWPYVCMYFTIIYLQGTFILSGIAKGWILLQVSGNANSDRETVYDIHTVAFTVVHMRRSGSIPRSEGSSSTREPELNDVIEFLNSGDPNVVANAASYLQHLAYGNDNMKSRIR